MAESLKEAYDGTLHEPVSLKRTEKIIEQMNKNICRIYNNNRQGTGFFLSIPYKMNLLPVLITSNQIINEEDILNNRNISLYLNNDKKIKTIKLDNNRTIYTNEKFDITIIEIKENIDKLNNSYFELDDEIINSFKLDKNSDINYLHHKYSNESIYILDYRKNKDIFVSYGKLSYLKNTELFYRCNIKRSSSGSPILLSNNQKLIGIHKNSKNYKYNKGNLLIYLLKEFSKIKKVQLLINHKGEYLINNLIIGEIDIKRVNQKVRIINSYEQYYRENNFNKYEKEYENEIEIKQNCEIRINNELIQFSYFYTFNKKGKYNIKYTFLLNITKTDYMFYDCSSLKKLNLSNFNTNNIKDMSFMFSNCSSLEYIDVSNSDNSNVKNMRGMLNECSSLININLNNFNTEIVFFLDFFFLFLFLFY